MRIAIVQSNYIPWKGYFDLIRSVDEFVLFDDAQYTRRDWRNRNRIKTAQGPLWLTIPVQTRGQFRAVDQGHRRSPIRTGARSTGVDPSPLRRSAVLPRVCGAIEALYLERSPRPLSAVNRASSTRSAVCSGFGRGSGGRWTSTSRRPTERLSASAGRRAPTPISPARAARVYLDEGLFRPGRHRGPVHRLLRIPVSTRSCIRRSITASASSTCSSTRDRRAAQYMLATDDAALGRRDLYRSAPYLAEFRPRLRAAAAARRRRLRDGARQRRVARRFAGMALRLLADDARRARSSTCRATSGTTRR